MRKDKSKEQKFNLFNVVKTIVFLLLIICIFMLAPNYVRTNEQTGKINLIINNNNVTARLKKDLYINEKNIVYMSITDIKNYLDKYIYYDKTENQIITTYGEKIAVLPLSENKMIINNSSLNLLSGIETKENEIYLPISQMANVYNMDITYVK